MFLIVYLLLHMCDSYLCVFIVSYLLVNCVRIKIYIYMYIHMPVICKIDVNTNDSIHNRPSHNGRHFTEIFSDVRMPSRE